MGILSPEIIDKNVYTTKISVKNYQNSFYSAYNQRKKKEKSATQKTLGLSHKLMQF